MTVRRSADTDVVSATDADSVGRAAGAVSTADWKTRRHVLLQRGRLTTHLTAGVTPRSFYRNGAVRPSVCLSVQAIL